jgi:hypothetical protein
MQTSPAKARATLQRVPRLWSARLACLAIAFPVSLSGRAQTSPLSPREIVSERDALAFCRDYEEAFGKKDLGRFGDLFASDFEGDRLPTREDAKNRLKALFDAHSVTRVTLRLLAFDPDPPCAAVTVQAAYDFSGESDLQQPTESTYVWVLERIDGRARLESEFEVSPDSVDRARLPAYESETAGFRVERPPGWIFLNPKRKGPASDLVFLFRPASRGIVYVGSVDLPRPTRAEDLHAAEDAVIRNRAGNSFQLVKSNSIEVNGIPGYASQFRCKIDDRSLQVWRLTFVSDQAMYVINCHSTPAERFESDHEAFERIVNSFHFTARTGKPEGALEGRIYRSAELRCQFAAPPGWIITPARSSFAFQVYVRPPEGKSFVLVGAEDFRCCVGKEQLTCVVDEMETTLKRIEPKIQQYRNAHDVVIDGRPAREVVWDLPLGDSALARRRKAVYFALGDHLCFIHCDAVPPEEFDRLEPEFDRLIRSFIRSQE